MMDRFRRWAGFAVFLMAVALSIMNVFISNVALPVIQETLDATPGELQMILAGYNLVFGIFLIAGGRMGDLFGIRRMFLIGLALFSAASAASALAPSANLLAVARAVQGLGAAFMIPQVLSYIQVSFTGKERAFALGAYAAAGGFASSIAQLAGGWLIGLDLLGSGWRAIYAFPVPVGVAAWIAAAMLVKEIRTEDRKGERLDVAGLILMSAALFALTLPLAFGKEWGWPWWLILTWASSPLLVFAFVRHQRSVERSGRAAPLVKTSLFRKRSFAFGNVMILLFYANNAVLFMALPMYVQRELGMTPLMSGLIFTPLAIGFAVVSLWSGKALDKIGERIVAYGCLLLGAAYGLFYAAEVSSSDAGSFYMWMPASLLAGAGMGLISAPLNAVTLKHVAHDEVGSASGIVTAGVEIAYAFGTVICGWIYFSSGGAFHPALLLNGALLAGMLAVMGMQRLAAERRDGGRSAVESKAVDRP
jgi:MFS family permease